MSSAGIRAGSPRLADFAAWVSAGGWRDLIRMAAVCTAASTAGLAIMMPISTGWFDAQPQQVDLMIRSVPRAMEAGAVVAVLATAAIVSLSSSRTAWAATTVAMLGILVNHAGLPWVDIDSLTTFNFIDSLWAGVILGSLLPVVWQQAITAGAYLFGCLASNIMGDLVQSPAVTGPADEFEGMLGGAPPLWLIVLSLALIAATVLIRGHLTPLPGPVLISPLAPIISSVVVVLTIAIASRWLADAGHRTTVIVMAVALVIIGAMLAALLLPGRDGVLVLLMVAFSTAASAVITLPRPWWADPLIVAATAVGLLAGWRHPRPYLGVAASGALSAVAAVLALTVGASVPGAVFGVVAIGLIGGYNLTSALPTRATSAIVAIAVLFVPAASAGLRGRSFGRVSYSPQWYRLSTITPEPAAGWASLAIAIGCAAGIHLLYRWRKPAPALELHPESADSSA
ncbi:hypothetical protein [Nocardia sp. NPDC057668]|uniref:hypothetical protein n=1 Tax=Nocardia sp. NPDC057668 TaxID=3346202 RepID=UPI003671498E